jgi:predicted ATP-grasp superfamily ATP-dependent carboligase
MTLERVERHPPLTGPSSVVRLTEIPPLAAAAKRFIAHCSYSGFAMPEFLVDRAAGTVHLLEFNPRPAPQAHFDEQTCGVDLCRAWHAHIAGQPPPTFVGPSAGRTIALFPQEWLRDPDSPYLGGETIQDVPKDDPALLQAYLTLRG